MPAPRFRRGQPPPPAHARSFSRSSGKPPHCPVYSCRRSVAQIAYRHESIYPRSAHLATHLPRGPISIGGCNRGCARVHSPGFRPLTSPHRVSAVRAHSPATSLTCFVLFCTMPRGWLSTAATARDTPVADGRPFPGLRPSTPGALEVSSYGEQPSTFHCRYAPDHR